MDNDSTKIRLVFIPYLIISIAILIGWPFLHWLLFVKLNLYDGKEGALVIITPLVLSATSIYIWLDKRIGLFSIEKYDFLYLLVPFVAMCGSSFFAQQYIVLTTGKVTHLSSISQIEQKLPAKFYSLKNFYLDKKHLSIKKQFSQSSGKSPSHLEMYLYVTVPILNSAKDTLGSNCSGWYGAQYHDTARDFLNHHDVKRSWDGIGNGYRFNDIGIDTLENSKEVKKFTRECLMKLNNTNHSLYWERIFQNESDYDDYVLAIKNNIKYDTNSDVVLLPYNESLTDRANDNLIYSLAVFGVGSLLFLIMVIYTDLESEEK